tara:strand:+ start:293123 stop:293407 length:285 start_codon:yes stop_codon:yes gene_type:complete
MDDPLKKLADALKNLENNDGREVDNLNSGIVFPLDVKLGKSEQEAINNARADSIKKGTPFKEPGEVSDEDVSQSVKSYADDVVKKLLDDAFRGS